jgi:hypothetical protein
MENGNYQYITDRKFYDLTDNECFTFSMFYSDCKKLNNEFGILSEAESFNMKLCDKVIHRESPINIFSALDHLNYSIKDLVICPHPLALQATAIISRIMDIIFSGIKSYSINDGEKLIDQYHDLFMGKLLQLIDESDHCCPKQLFLGRQKLISKLAEN